MKVLESMVYVGNRILFSMVLLMLMCVYAYLAPWGIGNVAMNLFVLCVSAFLYVVVWVPYAKLSLRYELVRIKNKYRNEQ
jgi:hypothetical protein